MKYIPYLAAALLLVGCTNDIQRTESPTFPETNTAIYFPTADETGSEADPTTGVTTHIVEIVRANTKGELTIPINIIENTDSVFVVPESVTFADGASSAEFEVSFPNAQLGTEYFLTLSVDADNTNPYLTEQATYQLSMTLISWTDVTEKAVIVDGFFSVYGIKGSDYPFYCDYQIAELPDGTVRYRFLNPYNVAAGEDCYPDIYGVYPTWALFGESDLVDPTAVGNMVVSIDNDGNATMPQFLIGADLGYGTEYGGSIIGNFYNLGETDKYEPGYFEDNVITFPEGSIYLYEDGAYTGGEMNIWLSAAEYQSAVSAVHIIDFNDASMQWDTLTAATTQYESELFNARWQQQPIYKAVDLDPDHGESSEFVNLYYLPSVYADGYGFAFYWNQEEGAISIPSNQPTGKTIFGKDIVISGNGTALANTYTIHGETVTELVFPLSVQTLSGNLIGEYTETYLFANGEITFSQADYLGDFTLSGLPWDEEAESKAAVSIAESEGKIAITGIPYAKSISATYDESNNTLAINAQNLATQKIDGQFKKMVLSPIANWDYTDEPLLLEATLRGTIEISPASEADGFVIYSTTDNKTYGGFTSIVLTPTAGSAAPAKHKPMAWVKNHNQLSTAHLTFQGKVRRTHTTENRL